MAANDASAEQRSSKRQCTGIKNFDEIDLGKFQLKDLGGGKAFPNIAGEFLIFNLNPRDWFRTTYGFDVNSKFDKPSFLGGKQPEKPDATESLNLRMILQPEQAKFLVELDNMAKQAFAGLVPDADWNDLVTEQPLWQSGKVFKVAVNLKGKDLTNIAVVADGKVIRDAGWEFLKPHLDRCTNFTRGDVKVVAKVKLWHVGEKAGLKLEAVQLALRPCRGLEIAFADSELLA